MGHGAGAAWRQPPGLTPPRRPDRRQALAGKIVDGNGEPLIASHTTKGKTRTAITSAVPFIAARQRITASYLRRVLRLAFLSPALTDATLAGKQPAHMDVRTLTPAGTVEASWWEQAATALLQA